MSLRAFMAEIPEKREKEFVLSERFADEQGKPVNWKIRSITAAEDRRIKDACFHYVNNAKGKAKKELDVLRYTALQTAACVIEPDLNDAELQDYYGVKDPVACLEKMLLPEEMNQLILEVNQLNGGNTLKEQIEDAKN